MSKLEAYTLTKRSLGKLVTYFERRGRPYICRRCGEPFKEGDKVIVVGNGSQTTKRYHESCYNEMLY